MWKKIAPRLLRAALGAWLVVGPPVVFLLRWNAALLILMYLALVAAFLFVGFMGWLAGADYFRRLGSDTMTALASVLIGGGLSGLIAKLTHHSLHLTVWFFPLVIVLGFIISEIYRERRAVAPAPAPQRD